VRRRTDQYGLFGPGKPSASPPCRLEIRYVRYRTERLASDIYPDLGKRWIARATRRNLVKYQHQEQAMNKDQTKGRIEEVKGKLKEISGQVVGNKELETKGKVQNIAGKTQAAFGDAKADLKKAVKGE